MNLEEMIPLEEFERHEAAMEATIIRIQAENTWLRHNFWELAQCVAQLKQEIATLCATVKKIDKALGGTAKKQPKTKTQPKTRSAK
jgi:hypothetical protein